MEEEKSFYSNQNFSFQYKKRNHNQIKKNNFNNNNIIKEEDENNFKENNKKIINDSNDFIKTPSKKKKKIFHNRQIKKISMKKNIQTLKIIKNHLQQHQKNQIKKINFFYKII